MMYTDVSRGRNMAKDPAVVFFQGKYYMYYSAAPGLDGDGGWDIGIAVSHDLEHWEKVCDIAREGEWELGGICAPGALVYDGKVHIFYQTYGDWLHAAICHAYSEDGIHFIRNQTNPIVRAEGDWNNHRAIDADVVEFQGMLYLYFATRDPKGEIQFQGVTRCPLDGIFARENWQQCCTEPILKPELSWEQQCIEAAATIVQDGKVYMFYAGAYNNCPQQIGVAVSEDGIHFSRLMDHPFLPCGKPGEWNASESGHPYVFRDLDNRIYLFFQGNNDNGQSWYLSKTEIGFCHGMPYIIG